MKNRVITISREFGSGGRTIGKAVAEQLGIPCYENEILQEIAKESGFEQSYIQETGEYAPGGFLAAAFSHPASGPSNADYLWEMQYKLIGQLAEKGPCVIVGRCADYILRDKADCLRVFIHADLFYRAKRIVEVYGEREKSPEQRLKDKDKRRAAYHRFYTDMKWGHAQKLRSDTQQRHTGNRQMRRNHQEPVLKNIPSTKGSITKRQENHLLPFF